MRMLRFAWLAVVRDWRSGDLAVLALALVVAVAALTAVGFFTSRVARAVEEQAGEIIAADLKLEAARPLDPGYLAAARDMGLATAELTSFPSVVFFGTENALAALRAVTDAYPLRGALRIADQPFGTPRATTELPRSGEVWADSRLLARLGAGVGDRVSVGASEFLVSHVLDYRPDQGSQFVDLAPTLLLRLSDLPATRLVQPGSRLTHAYLFAGPRTAIAELKTDLEARKRPGERLVAVADASPQVRTSMERAGRFLNLAALVSVLLAGIAVAMTARRFATRHLDTVALLKCLGASQRFVLGVSLTQLATLAGAATLVGSVLGFLSQYLIAWILRDVIRGALPPPTLAAAWLGLVTACLVLVGFALPPLLQLRRVPPARVLRRDLEPPPLRYAVVYGAAVAAVAAILLWLVRDWRLFAALAIGTLATAATLFAAGWLLVRALGRIRGRVGIAWRYGLANIARRGRESVAQIVAFGLGLMVLLLLALVRGDLLESWRSSLPANAPNHFLINIRPDEGEALRDFFVDRAIQPPELVPMVRARLTAINGKPVEQMHFDNDRAANFIEREANLTWSARLRAGNEIVAGQWWDETRDGGPQVSVERDIGEALGLRLGDVLTYDVAGEPISGRVTSLRKVAWDTFQPNFFMVFSPGVLDQATGTFITSVHLAPAARTMLVDLVRRFPEVTIIDVEAMLAQIRSVMDKASLAVQYVFLFTLFSGVTVLLAAVQSTREERRYESAMLRTLGASRRVVLQGVAAEFTTLGLLAGILAATGATIAAYLLATHVFNLEYRFDLVPWVVGLLAGAALVGVSGTLATRSVIDHPPVSTLRSG
jgi:putative ABC transport system permease protein